MDKTMGGPPSTADYAASAASDAQYNQKIDRVVLGALIITLIDKGVFTQSELHQNIEIIGGKPTDRGWTDPRLEKTKPKQSLLRKIFGGWVGI